jgi:SAM-dependent methyltransferase
MSLYQRILGIPFVYEKIRPLVVGGIDMSPSYANLQAGPGDVVLDIGCGTGDVLNYVPSFKALHGFDTDAMAISYARKRAGGRADVRFEARACTREDVQAIAPDVVMMNGLLHHLDDETACGLLSMCLQAPSVRRIATQDVVYLPGKHLSNLLAWLDRGKFVRSPEAFKALAVRAGGRVVRDELMRSHPDGGRAIYFLMAIERAA